MPRHIEILLDSIPLSAVGPYLVQQVHEDAPTLELTTGDRPGRSGQLLVARHRSELKVSVELQIRERFDLARRAYYVERLAAWANGLLAVSPSPRHRLELSNHAGRRLNVVCSADPAPMEARNPASLIRVEFTAHEIPFWEDQTPTWLALSGASGSGQITVPGTVDTPVSLIVTPTGGALTDCSVTAGGTSVALSGLNIPAETGLNLEQDIRDDLAITSGGASLLSCRSAASDDQLLVSPGTASVSFTANTACNVAFYLRGRWL